VSRKLLLADGITCLDCGDDVALLVRDDRVLCPSCADTRHRKGRCAICWRWAPIELHHPAREAHWPVVIPVCLTCHAILGRWQRALPRGRSHLYYIVQGTLDCLRLWSRRSPAAEQCRGVLQLLAQAALALCPFLHAGVLRVLTTIDVWEGD
jgi:DNA-directed RNA polymerase subunit RPC12/RpoP